MALSDNQIAYYKLDGNSNDAVGSANGTDTSISYGTGKIGNSADTDSVNDRIYLGNPASLQVSGAQTINFWIKASSQGANNRNIITAGGISGTSDGALIIFHYSPQYISFQVSNGTSGNAIDLTAPQTADILDGNWHMITFTFNPSTKIEVFKDGVSLASSTTSILASRQTNKNWSFFKINTDASANARDGLIGSLDEVGFWSRVLSGSEITELYNSGSGTQYPYATSVSVDAGVVTATISTQAPTVTGTANVSASVVTGTFSTPAPAITGDANVTSSVVTATFSLPLANIITPDAQFDASPLVATFSLPASTVEIDTSLSASVVTATFSLPASSVQIDFTHDADPLTANFSLPTPTLDTESNIIVSPDPLTATFSLPASTVTAEINGLAEVNVLSATFSMPAPTVTAIMNVSVDASVVTATFSINQPTKVGGLWTAQGRTEGVWTPQPRAV